MKIIMKQTSPESTNGQLIETANEDANDKGMTNA